MILHGLRYHDDIIHDIIRTVQTVPPYRLYRMTTFFGDGGVTVLTSALAIATAWVPVTVASMPAAT
jgi:hypothetical protein